MHLILNYLQEKLISFESTLIEVLVIDAVWAGDGNGLISSSFSFFT